MIRKTCLYRGLVKFLCNWIPVKTGNSNFTITTWSKWFGHCNCKDYNKRKSRTDSEKKNWSSFSLINWSGDFMTLHNNKLHLQNDHNKKFTALVKLERFDWDLKTNSTKRIICSKREVEWCKGSLNSKNSPLVLAVNRIILTMIDIWNWFL